MKQILFNLLSKAVKFTPESGKISIQVTDHADEGIEISVSDTGIGIDERDMDRIFMPFEQAVHSNSSKSRGTGLGLSLTKRLVELHGGKIWVESQGIGYGSTFRFVLPM